MANTNFEPVTTLEELDSLDSNQIVAGYMAGRKGYPEPQQSEGKAVWHGWRNGMIDTKRLPADEAYYSLARLIVARTKEKQEVT